MSFLTFSLGLAIGTGAGYVTSLFTAPKPGRDTQKDIEYKAKEIRLQTADQVDQLLQETENKLDNFQK